MLEVKRKKTPVLIALISAIILVLVVSFFVYLHAIEWTYKEYVIPLVYLGIVVFILYGSVNPHRELIIRMGII